VDLLNAMPSHKCCVSNRRLRNQIQIIAFITFLNDEIVVQEYISSAKIPYMHANFKNNAPQKRLPNTYESRVSFSPLLNDMLSHKHCVSNCMLRNQIQIITFITFFNDEIDVQEYISSATVSHMHDNFKNHAPQ
jgi:hypothetical protein